MERWMITYPPLPGAARLTEGHWKALEKAAKCKIADWARQQIDSAVATYRQREWQRCHFRADAPREAKRLEALARRAKRLADAAGSTGIAKESDQLASRAREYRYRRGRPGEPHLHELFATLSNIYYQIYFSAHLSPTTGTHKEFIRCTCEELAGRRIQSDPRSEAFDRKYREIFKGMTPDARERVRSKHLKNVYAEIRNTELGYMLESMSPHVTHVRGQHIIDYLDAVKRHRKTK